MTSPDSQYLLLIRQQKSYLLLKICVTADSTRSSRRTTGNPFADDTDEQEDALDVALRTHSSAVPASSAFTPQAPSGDLDTSAAGHTDLSHPSNVVTASNMPQPQQQQQQQRQSADSGQESMTLRLEAQHAPVPELGMQAAPQHMVHQVEAISTGNVDVSAIATGLTTETTINFLLLTEPFKETCLLALDQCLLCRCCKSLRACNSL